MQPLQIPRNMKDQTVMASRQKLSVSPVEVYRAWINCCLTETCDHQVNDLTEDLQDGNIFCQLIKLLTGHEITLHHVVNNVSTETGIVYCVIDYMKSKGIEVSCKAEDISNGDLKSMLDILWLIILHFEIHSANRAAYQRTVNLGKRFLLEWCSNELPDAAIDPRGTFIEFFQSGVLLTRLICKHCALDAVNPTHLQKLQLVDKILLLKVLNAAEVSLGIPKEILGSTLFQEIVAFDEYSLIIYLAVLRRKVSTLNVEGSGREEGKTVQTPSQPRSPQRTQKLQNGSTSPGKISNDGTRSAPVSLPLSPNSLRDLVAQQTKSHAAIQALQERVQAVSQQSTTPRLQKKLPEHLYKKMVPNENEPAVEGGITENRPQGLPQQIFLTDQNDNILAIDKDELFREISPSDDVAKELYTSVDRQFFELMLDAVQKGFVPPELTTENWLNSEACAELDLNGALELARVEPECLDTDGTKEEKLCLANDGLTNSETEMETVEQLSPVPNATSCSEAKSSDPQSTENEGSIRTTVETNEQRSDAVDAENSTPSKKIQVLGLDTVHTDTPIRDRPEGSRDACDQPYDKESNLDTDSNETNSKRVSVTWASLDLPSTRKSRASLYNSRSKSGSLLSLLDSEYYEECAKEDGDDPFMLYLNSIEQTALKFKLQVEQAKVDTLEALKSKLEFAYEGTPLEQIPSKFQEKLQETIAQIASDEVLKKYEALVGQEEEMSEEENEILECMRNELDSVASENFQLHQQLDLLKDYENKYLELRDKFDNLNHGMTSMKNECEKKNGESEFLTERVESLEKSILNLRVEYNNEIRELQDENLQLQKICFELESRNKALEEEAQANEHLGDEKSKCSKENTDFDRGGKFNVHRELEILQLRLDESERQNKALRAAAQADQAVIQCVQDKTEELEGSLAQSKDNHSKILLELHEAQRQLSSDRVKLSSYQEESDALQRENKLLKSSLDIAQQEIEYLMDNKETEKSEPWKSNKRKIWREIRELEKILKDVHKEKRNLEKKYANFKQESDKLSNSFSRQSFSPLRDAPLKEPSPLREGRSDDEMKGLKSKSCHSPTKRDEVKAAMNGGISDDDSISSSPRKVKSWLDSLDSPSEPAVNGGQLDPGQGNDSSIPFKRSPVNGLIRGAETDKSAAADEESGFSNELEQLRHHVGSLEAEKAAIVKELSSLRFSRIAR